MDQFVFKQYRIEADGTHISFIFEQNGTVYTERIQLPASIPTEKKTALLDALLFNLHLALGISYWKATCAPHMLIASGTLSREQAEFWNTVYTKGLSEFYYRNQIDFRGLVRFPYDAKKSSTPVKLGLNARELVGIGGGKDSVVVWEMFKQQQKDIRGLVIKTQHSYASIDQLVEKTHIPVLTVERTIDPAFIKQASQMRYNGHIPISMIYAWIGILCAYLYDYGAFVVANEKSADSGNTIMHGMGVNHQWSKTAEFEQLFQTYLRDYLTPSIRYYSPIRHLTELEIAKRCVSYPSYLPYIASCNRNFSITHEQKGRLWCGSCPKCAFAFLLFAAYLPKEEVVSLFGTNMLENHALTPLFMDLMGRGGLKPFECVGTFEESQKAIALIKEKGEFTIPKELI